MQMRVAETVAGLATALALLFMLADSGCAGSQKEAEAPAGSGDESGEGDGKLIPEEKYEEISATFVRKTGTVSRCYVEGVEGGEGEQSKKGHITIGLTINPDGSASDVRVMESSFKSAKVGECVVRMVSGWSFTTLPRPLETSHTYVLDRL